MENAQGVLPNVTREVVSYDILWWQFQLKIHNQILKNAMFFKIHFVQLFSAEATIFLKKLKKKNASKNIKNLPSEVAQYPPWLTVFIPASFFFVKLRQFYSLIYSHLWTFQTLQDEKIRKNTLPITLISLHLGILFIVVL